VLTSRLPNMIKQKSGKLFRSVNGGARGEACTHYGDSKGRIISLTTGLATELGGHGRTLVEQALSAGWSRRNIRKTVLS